MNSSDSGSPPPASESPAIAPNPAVSRPQVVAWWLFPVFFLSGTAALIYQIAWQRALFAVYGLDILSVTVVVTAFMLGLGIGSLLGGAFLGTVDGMVEESGPKTFRGGWLGALGAAEVVNA